MDSSFGLPVPGGGSPSPMPVVQGATPTSGQTVVVADTLADITLAVAPAGALAALTVTFPTDAGTRIGQFLRICTTQAITSLTLNGATVRDPALSAVLNDCSTYQKVGANTWMRMR